MKKPIIIRGDVRDPRNVLVDLPHGLGDQIMCFPLFASLKAHNPEMRITALSPNKASQFLLRHNRHVDQTFPLPADFTVKGLLRHLTKAVPVLRDKCRKDNFDLYINVHPNIIRSANMTLCGIKNRIENTRNIHKTAECISILSAMGIPPVIDYAMNSVLDPSILNKYGLKEKEYIVLDYYPQHFSRDPRRWDYFDDLADLLRKRGIATAAAGINKNHKGCRADVDLVNRTGFDELLAIIEGAKAVVCMDTGFFHMSYALKTPVLGIFGPVDPAERMPYDSSLPVDILYRKESCSPCIRNRVDIPCARKDEPYRCMRAIRPEDVIGKLETLLDGK
jgi:ADP-heptose:LPS heptosyltransferase